MRLFFDTAFLVNLERQREPAVALLESLRPAVELWISTITVAELLTGPYLRRDAEQALLKAKAVLGQFVWQDVGGTVAERAAQLQAALIATGRQVEYQDVLIAAGAIVAGCDALVSENKDHFTVHKPLAGKVFTSKEYAARLRRR